ncbi:MAG: hypothetical protein HQ568_09820, partial [Calditrichaeota bacterium]|nr:hypothetical protein [Calditrichota bacterium]
MNLRSIIVVYLKELKDILRDRRTLLSMILFPIILMPLMTIGMTRFMMSRIDKIKEQKALVAWVSNEIDDALRDKIDGIEGFDLVTTLTDTTLALQMLRFKDVDAVVWMPVGFYFKL